jgi:hypothetical protein
LNLKDQIYAYALAMRKAQLARIKADGGPDKDVLSTMESAARKKFLQLVDLQLTLNAGKVDAVEPLKER